MLTVVELPGGLIPDSGPPITEAELGTLSGADEAWLAGCPSHTPAAHVVTELLARTTSRLGPLASPTREHLRALTVGDRDYLLLTLRRMTLGPQMVAVLNCPACGCALDAEFETEAVPVQRRGPSTAGFETEIQREDGERVSVRFRCPTGADQEAVALLGADASPAALLARCVIAVDGRPAGGGDLALLDSTALAELDERMKEAAPRLDPAMDLECVECGAMFALDLDLAPFVLRELWSSARHVLHEVHRLAIHYHWSQSEIFALPVGTRRAYADLIGDQHRYDLEGQ